jgi:hypothetical protein
MAIKAKDTRYEKHSGMNDLLDSLKSIEDFLLVSGANVNFVPSTQGRVQIETREGTTALLSGAMVSGAASLVVQGLMYGEWQAGSQLVAGCGNKVYKIVGDTAIPMISGVANARWDYSYMEDKLLMFNGTDKKEMSYNTAPTDLGGTPPAGKYTTVFHNHVFVAGMAANKNRLQWSDLGDKDTWTVTNIQDMPEGEIMGLGVLSNSLYIFFKNAIKIMIGYGTSTFQFQEFSKGIGCMSHYGIVSNGSTLFFPSQQGIYAIGQLGATDQTVGGTSLIKLSVEKISNFWADLDLSDPTYISGTNDPARHCVRWSVKDKNETAQARELVFDYHESVLGFGYHSGRNISTYALSKDSYGNFILNYGSSNSGQLYKLDKDASTDDGTAIYQAVVTKAYDEGLPDVDKKYNTVDILAKGGDSEVPLNIEYAVGDHPGTTFTNLKTITTPTLPTWGTAIWGITKWQSDTFKNYIIALRKLGKALVMKLSVSTISKRITIAGWSINKQIFNKKNKTTI